MSDWADWQDRADAGRDAGGRRTFEPRRMVDGRPRPVEPVRCPQCGARAIRARRTQRGIYYVDLICSECGWADIDLEGGI